MHWPARACKVRATAQAGSRQHRGEKERGSQRQKKESGKKLEERNKIDLNKIWEKKRGDTRGAPTIAAGQAHVADRDTMGCDGMAGPVEKEKGWATPWKKRTARCWNCGKLGVASGARAAEKVLKKI
jgi:hypothetical protein